MTLVMLDMTADIDAARGAIARANDLWPGAFAGK